MHEQFHLILKYVSLSIFLVVCSNCASVESYDDISNMQFEQMLCDGTISQLNVDPKQEFQISAWREAFVGGLRVLRCPQKVFIANYESPIIPGKEEWAQAVADSLYVEGNVGVGADYKVRLDFHPRSRSPNLILKSISNPRIYDFDERS